MGSKGRFGRLLKSSVTALLAPADDPRAAYADPLQQQRALLAEVHAAAARLVVTKARLITQRDQAQGQARQLEHHARQALAAGREGIARSALQRQALVESETEPLNRQIAALEHEELALSLAGQRLSAQIEAICHREQIAAARHSAARAQVAASEALSGLGGNAETARRLERIEEAADRLEARAGAIDELLATGLLGDPATLPGQALAEAEIDFRLARLKAELAAAPPES